MVDQHQLRMTAYPAGFGPYDRWELTVEATGEVLLKGTDFPYDVEAIRSAVDAYRARIEAEANR